MYPVLFHIGATPVKAYGLFLVVALFLGLFLFFRWNRRHSREALTNVLLITFVSAIAGGRIFYLLFHSEALAAGWTAAFNFSDGGGSFFGAFLLGFPAFILALHWHKLPFWEVSDVAARIFPFGLATIRLGCLLAGCCHGTTCTLPWGIPDPSSPGVFLHPSPVYEIWFLASLAFAQKIWGHELRVSGVLAILSMLAYVVYRFIADFLRGDTEVYYFGYFSDSQLAAAFLFVCGAILLGWRIRKSVTSLAKN